MAKNIPTGLAERVDYATWRRADAESSRYQVKQPSLSGDEIPGWTLHAARRIDLEGTPPFLRSSWVRSAGDIDPLLLVDIHVADSPDEARALALLLLGDFQSPEVARRTDRPIGEVAFGDGSAGWVVFVRGNLVIWVRNGGKRVAPVLDEAEAVDRAITRGAESGGSPPG